ncbi:DUF262 domain-containing protein [Oscillatoria sp. FACHB-1407]|uniref:GmrSD restriction endonuclease domain-containing protein n=1 Tax=Oscillatoria sp. FACHB-1407 TaxID=2692847 RepID=UPI0016886030|nr:DUF262 domain-containing protein [Oscillatoria sp. FACHB-1407]MBD2465970.1 DUF262 domain-containing protein [Oscillatoria sp. FACHB-1407]
MNISTILDQIDMGSIALPEFQRGYVWNREQVRNLMDSLYRRHPVGSLLVWETKTEQAVDHARGDGQLAAGVVKLLLDGQQRITSLYGIIRGKAPKFFDGNAQAFTGLYFNLEDETFEFYSPKKMEGSPLWINVTNLMQRGIGEFMQPLFTNPDYQSKLNNYLQRINAVEGIKNINLHIEEVTGTDKTVDVVVEIFNKVNSGGTKLSKGDLALAKICAEYPDARDELKKRLKKWANAGFYFRMELFLRCINAIMTNEALFSALKDVTTDRFKKGLLEAETAVDTLLNKIASRLGLDHDRVLGSPYAFPLMARYLDQRGGHLDAQDWNRLLYWYIHTILWGRYAGSTESVLRQDLLAISSPDGNLENLIALLRQNRGDLRIKPDDFKAWSMGSRFYPLLYMLTRVHGAKDWEDDLPISQHLLGSLSSLEIHHIFPKSKLYRHGYSRAEVNAIANFTFLTKDTNLKVSNRDPVEYFAAYEAKHPGTIASHWIPMDPELWKYENYRDFLAARRELLAQAANSFLDSLYSGIIPEPEVTTSVLERQIVAIPGGIASEAEDQALQACNTWVAEQGLPEGELMYELVNPDTGEAIAVLDLAWTNGLQEGLSQPVALLIDEDPALEQIVNQAGYRFFTDIDSFKQYVQREVLALEQELAIAS